MKELSPQRQPVVETEAVVSEQLEQQGPEGLRRLESWGLELDHLLVLPV